MSWSLIRQARYTTKALLRVTIPESIGVNLEGSAQPLVLVSRLRTATLLIRLLSNSLSERVWASIKPQKLPTAQYSFSFYSLASLEVRLVVLSPALSCMLANNFDW